MPPPVIGKTPNYQLWALPLQDAATAAAGGDIVILGNTITRYWSPTVLGINAVSMVDDGTGHFYLLTGFLDVRGCRSFVLMVRRTISDSSAQPAIAAAANPNLRYQYRFSNAENPPAFYAGGDNFKMVLTLNAVTAQFPAIGAGESQTIFQSWDLAGGNASPSITIGTDVRFQLYSSTNNPGALNQWTVAMWGSG